MTTIEKLYEVSRQLPDQLQTELLDFAEFLMQRTPKERKPDFKGNRLVCR